MCTTELGYMAELQPDFECRKAKVIGSSPTMCRGTNGSLRVRGAIQGIAERRGMGLRMGQSQLVDIAIGVVFVWFLFSLLLSVVNEALALVFRIRAKQLWLAIGHMIAPAATKQGRKLLDTFIRLPFRPSRKDLELRPVATDDSADAPNPADPGPLRTKIQKGAEDRQADAAGNPAAGELQRIYSAAAPMLSDVAKQGRRSKLTKLPAEVFSSAVASIAAPVHKAELLSAATGPVWTAARLAVVNAAVASINDGQVVTRDQVTGWAGDVADAAQLGDLYDAAAQLGIPTGADLVAFWEQNPALQAAVRRAINAAGVTDTVAAARTTIESWYDREMDRLSAAYRRQNRKVLAVLSLPLVLFFHANAIGTAIELNHDSALRASLVNGAISATDQATLTGATNQRCAPATTTTSAPTAPPPTPTTAAPQPGAGSDTQSPATTDPFRGAVDKVSCAGKIVAAAQQFRLVPDLHKITLDPRKVWHYEARDWGLLGRLVTLVALTFGAQFWFDVLRRLVGLRGALAATPPRGGS